MPPAGEKDYVYKNTGMLNAADSQARAPNAKIPDGLPHPMLFSTLGAQMKEKASDYRSEYAS